MSKKGKYVSHKDIKVPQESRSYKRSEKGHYINTSNSKVPPKVQKLIEKSIKEHAEVWRELAKY